MENILQKNGEPQKPPAQVRSRQTMVKPDHGQRAQEWVRPGKSLMSIVFKTCYCQPLQFLQEMRGNRGIMLEMQVVQGFS